MSEIRQIADGIKRTAGQRAILQSMLCNRPPTNQELEDLYAYDAMAARIVDRPADDATRKAVHIEGEGVDSKAFDSKFDDLDLLPTLNAAVRSARLYGGSLIVADDGGKPDRPLKGPIQKLYVVDAPDARPSLQNATLAAVLNPRAYDVSLGTSFATIDASRTIRIDGVALPTRMLALTRTTTNYGWGPSVLQRLRLFLQRLRAAQDHVADLLHVLSVPGLKITDLKKQLLSVDGRAEVMELLTAIKESMSSTGLLAIDKQDEPFTITREARGAVDLIGSIMAGLVAATDMPSEIMTGQTPGGLNTGAIAGPIRLYYDSVDAYRVGKLSPAVSWIAERVGLPLPEEWAPAWEPLWQPSTAEQVAEYKTQAEADAIYVATINAAQPDEVRQKRFVEGAAGPLELSPIKPPPDPVVGGEITPAVAALPPPASPAEEALNGAQGAMLTNTLVLLNTRAITYAQARGAIAAMLPDYRGREQELLGPEEGLPPPPIAPAGGPPAAPTAPPPDEPPPSSVPLPGDAVSPREAASSYNLPTRTITLAIERGELSYWKIGSQRRVSLAEVAALSKRHEEEEDP